MYAKTPRPLLSLAWAALFICVCLFAAPGARAQSPPQTQHEFEAQARLLMNSPSLSGALLDVCENASPHALDDPAYMASVHGFRSHAFWLANDFAKAEAEARNALALDPDSAMGYFFLSDALNAQRRFDEAYTVCLFGAGRTKGPYLQSARAHCRVDYLKRISLSPGAALASVRNKRLSIGYELLIRGTIHALEGDTVIFKTQAGAVQCHLLPQQNGSGLTPGTDAEGRKQTRPVHGLKVGEFVVVQGVVAKMTQTFLHLKDGALVPL